VTGKLDEELTQEQKEKFLAVWQERRPEVLEWSDEEIHSPDANADW
jgi:hypothetical protein